MDSLKNTIYKWALKVHVATNGAINFRCISCSLELQKKKKKEYKDGSIISHLWLDFFFSLFISLTKLFQKLFFFSDEVKTTLLLNVSQGDQKTYNATLFESLKESSVFYQRPVDDILFFDASNGILQCCNSSSNTSLSSIQSDLRKGQKRPRSSSTSKRPPPQSQQPSTKKGLIENVVYNEVEEIAPNSPSRKLATNNINR